jgi:hypothetical protein
MHQIIPVLSDCVVVLSIMSDSCQDSDNIGQMHTKSVMLAPGNPTDSHNQTTLPPVARASSRRHGSGKTDANGDCLSMQNTMATRSSARTRQGKVCHSQPVVGITPAQNQQI